MLHCKSVRNTIPGGPDVTLQLFERIDVRIGLQDPVGQTLAYFFATANVLESTESPLA